MGMQRIERSRGEWCEQQNIAQHTKAVQSANCVCSSEKKGRVETCECKEKQNGALQRGVRIYMGVWPKAEYSYGGGRRAALTRLCLPPRDQIHIFVQTYEGHLTNIFRRWQFIAIHCHKPSLAHVCHPDYLVDTPREMRQGQLFYMLYKYPHEKRRDIVPTNSLHWLGI